MKQAAGILPLYKPAGMTSFDTIRQVKKNLGIRKIGHTGTLDKFAEGLLILLHGRYTRLASLFLNQGKEYIARIRLGTTTETLDPEGKITATGPVPDRATLEACLPAFTGTINQVPPRYSAVHVAGQRAYKLARQGATPTLTARPVTIYSLDLLAYDAPELILRISCSKGTYIRSLARDLGAAAGSCAYVTDLKRTAVGGFLLNEAVSLTELDTYQDEYTPRRLASALEGVDLLTLREEFREKILTGVQPQPGFFREARSAPGDYFVLDENGALLAVITRTAGKYQYKLVLGDPGG